MHLMGKTQTGNILILTFSKHTHRKQEAFEYDVTVPSESGSKHVDDAVFKMAEERDY